MRSRFAPTPSGFLHEGNLVNLLLVSWLCEREGGELLLRIDNVDAQRQRPEYVQDIFDTLKWLNVRWSLGPQSIAELDHMTATHVGEDFAHWRSKLLKLRRPYQAIKRDALHTFVCRCSRRDLALVGSRACIGDCAALDLELVTGQTCLRGLLPEAHGALGQPVLWRREGIAAYHLASIVDDDQLGITHVVRGADLLEATQIQLLLADVLGLDQIRQIVFLHHELLHDSTGEKLSKSTLKQGAPLAKTDERKARVVALATEFGKPLGITPPL